MSSKNQAADSEDPLEGTSLFNSVLSGFTDEQWNEYKKQRSALEGGTIMDYDSESDEDIPDSLYEFGSNVVTNVEIIHDKEKRKDDVSDMEDDDDMSYSEEEFVDDDKDEDYHPEPCKVKKPNVKFNSDAAVKYVNGEISFSELADIMESSSSKSRKRTSKGNFKEDDDNENDVSKVKIKRRRRRRCELPKDLLGLMGMANMNFAKGDTQGATNICLELIRQAPLAQQPYQTLSMIHEESGDIKQSLQCALLAAYLNPSDTEEWIRLAGLSLEQSQIQQAIRCYTFAIRNDPQNINYLWERCNLYEGLGDRKNALSGYEQILQVLSRPEDGEKCVEISREVAKVHHENEDLVNAIKVLENAFTKFPALITSEDVNFLLELQISKKYFKAALKNFVHHCGVTLYIGDDVISLPESVEKLAEAEMKDINKCSVPDLLPIDLQVKLLLCLIHAEALESISDLLSSLQQESADEMGDLYLDVAEAYMDIKDFTAAMPLLTSLISSEKYNLAAVWLKYGDCLNNLNRGKEATVAYQTVLRMAPSYQEARVSLSKILIENGKKQEAAKALKQEYEDGKLDAPVDLQVLIERCTHLYELEEYNEFIEASKLALYSHCYMLETNEEFTAMINNQSFRRRADALRDLPSIFNRHQPTFHNIKTSTAVMWDLFYKLCEKLYEYQRFEELQKICLESMASTVFRKDKTIAKDSEFLGLLSCLYNKSYKYSYTFIRDILLKKLHCNRAWNLLCLNFTYNPQIRHNRFCLRLMIKNPEHKALGLLNGHCAMNSGSYKHALGLYIQFLKKQPDDPLLLFFTGITYTHIACQKFATKHYILIAQAIAFLQRYMELRQLDQEAYYNLGRAFHQLGIKDAATVYYRKALEAAPAFTEGEEMETFDLKHEIAFNLALIYQSSGSMQLASSILRKYNVV